VSPAHHPGRRPFGVALLLLITSLFPLACSEDTVTSPSGTPGGGTAPVAVDSYLRGLPSWELFSPQLAAADTIAGNATGTTNDVDGTTYDCTSTPYSITETPDRVVTLDPDQNILWLGALLEGGGYRQGIGSLREWTVRDRAPLDISIDILSDSNTQRVEHPTLASVNQAVGQLIQRAEDNGHRAGSAVAFSQENTYSVNQAMLRLGISAGYASVTVKASLSASRTAAERTVTAYFVQRMFTVSMVLPSTPGDLFSADFTAARLQEERDRGHIGDNNIPVYVASITYGRILMFSFTSTANITDIRAALSASFSSIAGGSIAGRYLDILNEAKIKVVTLGGEGRNATALIQNGQLKDYFDDEPALTSARPISYVVRNVGDNSIAKVSETSSYDLDECTALPSTGTMHVDVTPNDASVYVSGPNNTTYGPSAGDQDLTGLLPGGYTIVVARAGYDTTQFDTSLAAGEDLYVPVALQDTALAPTGAFYTVRLTSLAINSVGCTGETSPDIFYSVRLNGTTVASVAQANSITLQAGQSITINKTWSDTVRTSIQLDVGITDDDGVINPADPVGSKSVTWRFPNIPTGTGLKVTVNNVSGCSSVLWFNITKGVDVFTAPPPPPPVTVARSD